MATRFYLNAKGIEQIKKGAPGAADTLGGFAVYLENGAHYLSVQGDLMDPAVTIKMPSGRVMSHVTYTDSYVEGLRPEGLYVLGKTTAKVESRAPTSEGARRQYISIKATSVAKAKEIYTKVRSGDILPTTRWHEHNPQPPREHHSEYVAGGGPQEV